MAAKRKANARDELLCDELIGKTVAIRDSANATMVGLEGTIIDETKNNVVIETPAGSRKRAIKDHHTFAFTKHQHTIHIQGTELIGRPEERIKKWLRKRKRQKA